jgi:uncharacterized protein YqeY
MTIPRETVERDLKAAMKAGEKERLATLRLLLTDLKNEQIRRGSEVDGDAFAAVVRKAIKQRGEAAEQYRAGGRPELAAKEEREAALLEAYLPPQADEAEIRAAIAAFVAAQGLAGPKGIGPVMREMLARFGATADGGTINRIAREVLGGGG